MAAVSNLLRTLTEGVKVSSMARVVQPHQVYWRKRRRVSARVILPVANAFFTLARARLRASLSTAAWQHWGFECFNGLHGPEGFRAWVEDANSISSQELPGRNLTDFLDTDRLTSAQAGAAGRELRRAHGWRSPTLGAAWSHGDAHAGNFILQEEPLRARIIDFELMHLAKLPPEMRQADDLAGFLLDLVGRISVEKWLPCAEGFLRGYGPSPLLPTVAERLANPGRGPFARLWRGVQTGFLSPAEYRRRLEPLLHSGWFSPPAAYAGPADEAQPSALVATTHSLTGTPPSRCS